MKIIISHPTSNQFNRYLVEGLQKANSIHEFHTSVATFSGDILDKISSIPQFKEIKRRNFDLELKNITRTSPYKEMGRMIASKIGANSLTKHETGLFSVDSVYRHIDKKVASKIVNSHCDNLNSVYAYEDGAYYSFLEAKKKNIKCLYDLPIGYWRTAHKMLSLEKERWPDWAPTLTSLKDSKNKLLRKDEELNLADRIFVTSSFTANSLNDYPGKLPPIEIIPYGFPEIVSSRSYDTSKNKTKLKLLFVGGLSQRKGIADVFSVADILKDHVSLTIVGKKATNDCPVLDKALSKHNWIPTLPHEDVLKLMHSHDVLLFPSLFEGFGMVITEAMSQGTPVITTERTAGPDLINHNENGWLIKAGSTSELQQCVEKLLEKPSKIAEVGKAARESARLRPWEIYGKELAEAVIKFSY